MHRAISRAPFHAPLPFLLHRHPLRAALWRWRFLWRWILPGERSHARPARRRAF
jgi:hypothetical protein